MVHVGGSVVMWGGKMTKIGQNEDCQNADYINNLRFGGAGGKAAGLVTRKENRIYTVKYTKKINSLL